MNMRAAPAALMPALHPVSLRVNTYLINLDRAPLRRFRMERLLASFGLAFERVAAVDGAGLSLPHPGFDEAAYLSRHGRRPNPFEMKAQGGAADRVAFARHRADPQGGSGRPARHGPGTPRRRRARTSMSHDQKP